MEYIIKSLPSGTMYTYTYTYTYDGVSTVWTLCIR